MKDIECQQDGVKAEDGLKTDDCVREMKDDEICFRERDVWDERPCGK